MSKSVYITTTLPYVNSDPHVGFALELVRADVLARYHKLKGAEVFLNTGTDEHGTKIHRKAKELGEDVQKYVDRLAVVYKDLIPKLDILPETNFIRTTDPQHIAAAAQFWQVVDKNGFIYKKNYSVKYCVGCELEKTESELVNGRCPLHPLQDLELIEEENYFFKFSAFGDKLLEIYKDVPQFVIPATRQNEIRSFVAQGLEDFSISRLASKMPWGVPVPGDDKHVMYVWFDALVNYISAVGWPHDMESFQKWWVDSGGVIQYCGKDNLRQQAAMWQAMLIAAGLPRSQSIIIDGFVTGEGGLKMSKSLGNTIDPFELIAEYGVDAFRYFVTRELHPFEDSPFTKDKFKESYNAHLANGLGNLVSRVIKMATTNGVNLDPKKYQELAKSSEISALYERQEKAYNAFNLQEVTAVIWELISSTDKIVQDRAPFKKIKVDPEGAKADLSELLARLYIISIMLEPILPSTASKIREHIEANSMPESPLFMRK
jgi:methionyl-tRNA synthetase